MNKIVRKEQFSEKVFLFEIEAPLIAKSRKPSLALTSRKARSRWWSRWWVSRLRNSVP